MKKRLLTVLLVLFAAVAAHAAYVLAPPKPQEEATLYSPVSGGHTDEPTYALNALGGTVFSVPSTSVGMTVSEKGGNLYVGDSLQPPEGLQIDWTKYPEALTNQAACVKGYCFWTGSSDPADRIVVCNYGTFELEWALVGDETVKVRYETGLRPNNEQSKLFWTSSPHNGPAVTLPSNYGIKIMGSPDLMYKEKDEKGKDRAAYDYGVHMFQQSGNTLLECYAKDDKGPVGVIVVAYYSITGANAGYLGSTVVRVMKADPIYMTAYVGDEVRPQNENYDPTQDTLYTAEAGRNSTGETTDTRSPYFYHQKYLSDSYHAKANRVFAISETEAGEKGAKKAEVYWKRSDAFNVFWPFEATCYHIKWPDCPTILADKQDTTLRTLTVPDVYSPLLEGWRTPSDVVGQPQGGTIAISKAGHFLLKLMNETADDFWYLPLNVAYSDDDRFDLAKPVNVPVGKEILPTVTSDSTSRQRALVNSVDTSLPGRIIERMSEGRNWNANLYHPDGASGASDAFGSLGSSIYLVNVSDRPYDVEVWWLRQYKKSGMTEPLVIPVLPQHYKAVWPERDTVGDVVFASCHGSAAGSLVSGGKGLLFAKPDALGTLACRFAGEVHKSMSLAFSFNPSPEDNLAETPTAGDVLRFACGQTNIAFRVDKPQTSTDRAVCTLRCGNVEKSFTCPRDQWSSFIVNVTTNQMRLYADSRLVCGSEGDFRRLFKGEKCLLTVGASTNGTKAVGAAVGAAIDSIAAWNEALTEDEIRILATNRLERIYERAALALGFDSAREHASGIFADEMNGSPFNSSGFAAAEPGAPIWDEGLFAVSDGVTPRAYVQNDASKVGYKPNVEHALTLVEGDGRYALYALRTDMNGDADPPYALVEYAENGRGAMRCFRVAMTNEWYAWPTLDGTAGNQMPLVRPYDAMPSGKCPDLSCWTPVGGADATVTFRDRTGIWWLRRDGVFRQHMRYFGETGFVVAAGIDRDTAGKILPAAKLENCYAWSARPTVKFGRTAPDEPTGGARGDDQIVQRDLNWLQKQSATPFDVRAHWPSSPKVMSVAQVLSKPEYGLPDVYSMKSCGVIYPFYGHSGGDGMQQTHDDWWRDKTKKPHVATNRVAMLVDPTRRKSVSLSYETNFLADYGLSLGPSGNVVNRKGLYYFLNMPANVADRLFIDVTSAGTGKVDLCLVGDYVDNAAGTGYLRINSLSRDECAGVRSVIDAIGEKATEIAVRTRLEELSKAVQTLYETPDVQPSRQLGLTVKDTTDAGFSEVLVTNDYQSADHYALIATGEGGGYVTLVENGDTKAGNLPVRLHVLYVTNTLYCGKIVPVSDPNDSLTEKLSVLYTAPLGKAADNFTFDWHVTDAPESGHVPTVPGRPTDLPSDLSVPGGDSAWTRLSPAKSGDGLAVIDAVSDNSGKPSMRNLVNRYWTMHYHAKPNTQVYELVGGGWSNWCPPTLAEGWVQRVLNAITPFSQRLADLSSNKAELKYTMLGQIGGPWEGDVALNNENLNNVGLIQLYQTILNRAESMSIAQGSATSADATTAAVNQQLVECVARLADMYMTLAAEAYSDAQNPLIASSDGTEYPGSVFCFANQVPSLLDEELALLRGRTAGVAPALTESPFYNRLMWNFTKGVTQGEVAYVNNYNISAVDGVLDAAAAASMYPQGHGDAYGHYLSALKGYYRLLRNPAFRWGDPAMMQMLVAGHVVSMDYEEEDKFAECAYNLAKIGTEVVKLTARKQWRDNAEDIQSGYFDNTNTVRTTTTSSTFTSTSTSTFTSTSTSSHPLALPQAFGYGEWGCRAGYGALCNWAVANALLPPDATNAVSYFADTSISTITRQTASSLRPLAQQVALVENAVNAVDQGLNPLGLSPNAIPFDISPADFRGSLTGQGAKSHYEQIRERAGVALDNAKKVLDYANVYGARLRAIENEEFDANADAAEQEASYERQLIAVYGRPFSDDIGPGKTYEQGYAGPDLYHYMYMNLSEYGLSSVTSECQTLTFYSLNYDQAQQALKTGSSAIDVAALAKSGTGPTMSLSLTADGLVSMPTGWTGTRTCEGSLQAAYRSFLSAYAQLKRAQTDYQAAQSSWDWQIKVAIETAAADKNLKDALEKSYNYQKRLQKGNLAVNISSTVVSYFTDILSKTFGFTTPALQNQIVGMAFSIPIGSAFAAAFGASGAVVYQAMNMGQKALSISSLSLQHAVTIDNLNNQLRQLESTEFSNRKSIIEAVRTANSGLYAAMKTLESAYTAVVTAKESYRTVAEEGLQILAARQQWRQRQVNVATQRRYADMYARVAHNAALSKFSTTFDVAQRYVFELAKVYDYETGLDVSDSASGKAFVNATIGTRALGAQGVTTDGSVTDGGLWDLVTRMDANFAQLKGRLGINNPDISTKWFSLRYSNCRISPEADGDEAWREELRKHWTSDILSDARFKAHCEPPVRAGNARIAEPGFVFEFATSVNLAENFFGKTLQGGETKYSSSDYAVKIYAAGVDFTGYADAVSLSGGLADEPNVYLVPIGKDYMRAPLSSDRKVIGFSVVDQVLPLPYDIGENELLSTDWVSVFNGLDGSADSAAKIRRHSTLRMGGATGSTRLVGRSVWNDRWLLVIPAAEMNANTDLARERFLKFVTDIRIGIQAYSRSGN